MENRPVKVFLAEDHAPDVMLIEEALQGAGIKYQLDWFEDGESAARRLSEFDATNRPELILLDLNLPKQTGFGLLQRIRESPVIRHVPVVILTSSRAPADRDRATALGVEAFITKPTSLDEFLTTIGEAVRDLLIRRGTRLNADCRRRRCGRAAGRLIVGLPRGSDVCITLRTRAHGTHSGSAATFGMRAHATRSLDVVLPFRTVDEPA